MTGLPSPTERAAFAQIWPRLRPLHREDQPGDDHGWYWWPWTERIAAASDPLTAASDPLTADRRVTTALRTPAGEPR